MKILLAYPAFPKDTFWSFDSALRVAGRRATMPPLGLLTVAAMFPTDRFELRLVDENVAPVTDGDLDWADAVLVSAMVAQLPAAEVLLARCRASGTPVVAGGPLFSGCFRELRRRGLCATSVFIGEAERLLPRLVTDLEAGMLRPAYADVADDERAGVVREHFGESARVLVAPPPSLDESPVPRFDLIEQRHYHSMAVQASRGCPMACEFCDIWKQFGLKSRTRPAAGLIAQLDYLFALGWKGRVFVVDDNFIGNVGTVRALLAELEAWQREPKRFRVPAGYEQALVPGRLARLRARARKRAAIRHPFAFCTEADVRIGDAAPKMTAIRTAMQRAGFNSIFLGIETPSREALLEANKRVNVGREGDAAAGLLERVWRVQEAGMEVMAGFILGFDNDPADADRAMADFIERAGIPIAMVGLLGVLPGTALQERLVAEGRFLGELYGAQTHDFRLNYRPRGRSARRVLDQYANVLTEVHGRGMRPLLARVEATMERMGRPPRTGEGVGLRELRAFAISLVRVRPRLAYWRFLARTLLRRQAFLPFAVVLALQADHLHRLTVEKVGRYRASRSALPESSAALRAELALEP